MTDTQLIPALAVGDRVRFGTPTSEARKWWTVRAGDARYSVLTRQADFRPKGESFYTIIDRERGVRGPCNLIGQGWDVDEPDGCQDLLLALQRADLSAEEMGRLYDEWDRDPKGRYPVTVEVSYRNNVMVDIIELVRAAGGASAFAPVAPPIKGVYFNGKPIGDAVVGGDFTFAPARADEEERPVLKALPATFTLSLSVDPKVWRRFAISMEYAIRQVTLFADVLRASRRRPSVADVVAARGRVHRLRGWRRRQLARLDNEVAPVAHLVKPSARRPGRRAHRRRSR